MNNIYFNDFEDDFIIKKVVVNGPATIVIWNDGTKTVVKSDEAFVSPLTGVLMCLYKKLFDSDDYHKLCSNLTDILMRNSYELEKFVDKKIRYAIALKEAQERFDKASDEAIDAINEFENAKNAYLNVIFGD